MKHPLHLGHTDEGEDLTLPLAALRRHAIVLGSTGSGKTVLCKAIVEEVARKGLPVIAIDPQGDLASLGLQGDTETLERMGVDPEIARSYHDRVDLKIWTPGSSSGIPISMAPDLSVSQSDGFEQRIQAYASAADSLADLVGYSSVSDAGQAMRIALSSILEYADEHELKCDTLAWVAAFLRDPPAGLLSTLDTVVTEKARKDAARRLQLRTMGVNRLLFDMGQPIDVMSLFGYEPGGPASQGKTRVSVIYLNTLGSFDDKVMFVSMLASALYRWMLHQSGEYPVGLVYLDEIAPYMPPTKKPPSKDGLMLLLRQARKYGLCMLLATQSPGDIDYKGLAQVGSWFLGKISTRQELAKVEPRLRADAQLDLGDMIDSLPGFGAGQFVAINGDVFEGAQEFRARWLVSRHETLSPDDVSQIVTDAERSYYG